MLRLRTTTSLSVLALVIGIAGTGWLSTLTAGWAGPPSRLATTQHPTRNVRHALPSPRRWHGPVKVVQARPARTDAAASTDDMASATVAPVPLIPLAMPGDSSQTWDNLRGHLDGRVVLHVGIDGSGRVSAASMSESSGDPILDAHALRSVRGWRFAVPVDHPDGISGELPMRFSSRGDGIARLP